MHKQSMNPVQYMSYKQSMIKDWSFGASWNGDAILNSASSGVVSMALCTSCAYTMTHIGLNHGPLDSRVSTGYSTHSATPLCSLNALQQQQ